MTDISVLIVSFRTPALTLQAARSALSVQRVGQVIVVDNASGDESVELLHDEEDDRLRVIVNDANAGYGAAANLAAAEADGEVLVFLNSDAELTDHAAETLYAEVRRFGGRCIVAPRLVGADGAVQRSAGLLPLPSDLAVRALGLHRIGAAMDRWPLLGALVRSSRMAREYESAVQGEDAFETTMVTGAVSAIGREAFEDLSGFDERFFLYFEDADLCRRAASARMPIRYLPASVVPHLGGASSGTDYHFGPLHARSMRLYLAKWHGRGGSVLALTLLWLRAMGMTIGLRPGAPHAWRAFWAAIRDEDPRR